MNPLLMIVAFLSFMLAVLAIADEPRTGAVTTDASGGMIIDAKVPAGTRCASLEISSDLSSTTWRPMIAGALDGRVARVTFHLPAQGGEKLFARVRTSTGATLPTVELSDPGLFNVAYGEPVPQEVKVNFLNQGGAKMREWKSLPRQQYQANLISWANSDPNVEEAYASDVSGNICIRFKDGNTCILMNKPRTAADAGNEMPRTAAATPATLAAFSGVSPKTVAIGSIPGSNRAITAFSLENGYPNSAPTIANWLRQRGYAPTIQNSATLTDVMSWSSGGNPLGVLFWHAHGTTFKWKDGTPTVAFITRQFTHPYTSVPVYTQMYDNGELTMAKDDSEALPVWGITSKFVRNRMRFAPHSLVVMDACDGANADMAKAFFAAGAGSYASWDWLSGDDSGASCRKVFDRLLGMNEENPISSPPERSFSLAAIQQWMTEKGYDYDPSSKYKNQPRPNARLIWFHNPSAPANILMPSIMRVLAEASAPGEQYSKYLIEGDFGTDPGPSKRSVFWGEREMQVVRWDGINGITIRLPQNPPKGELQVLLKKDFYSFSNKTPITEWTVPFTYELRGEGSLGAIMELSVKFRGDIHGSRYLPEMAVQRLPVVFNNMADCTGTVTASGSHSPGEGTTITWYGGSSLTSRDMNEGGPVPPDKIIFNNGTLNMTTGRSQMFALSASGPFTQKTRVVDSEGRVYEDVDEMDLGLDAFYLFFTDPARFSATTSVLQGGTRSFGQQAELTWPAVTPAFAPDEFTPR